ncbi:hypothetical protein CYY_002993 [Polysphondylium violaceum]|uniref:Transmembrane protein n=1 Tax=Polysphondylium violaceum TaxID=133409 RepID=A0A8J4PYC8_9MYCE|nr:hypothetical protein CYY_002993 [Polysphondylium violaceum]
MTMVKGGTMAAFIMLVMVWVLLIVSYSTYWYVVRAGSDDNYTLYSYNYKGVKKYSNPYYYGKFSVTNSYSQLYKHIYPNAIRLFQSSLSFVILAWIATSFTLFCMILNFFGILQKIPIVKYIVKFIPIIIFFFCVLSVCIFAGYQNVKYSDCKKYYHQNAHQNCEKTPFFQSREAYYSRPGPAWFTTLASAILSLAGVVIMFAGNALPID